MSFYVYVLRDPRTNEIRYVGKSSNPKSRLRGHICLAKNGGQYYSSRWIRELLRDNLKPIMEIMTQCNNEDLILSCEVQLIDFLRKFGVRLTNLTDGGEGVSGYKASQETIEKLRKAHLGKKLSQEHRENLAAAGREWRATHKIPPKSESTRAKIREARAGQVVTEETRKKQSAGLMGHFVSKETAKKISDAKKGKKFSEEHRKKLSAARKGWKPSPERVARFVNMIKGKPMPEEQRRKISEAKKGKPFTPEHRANINAAQFKRRKRKITEVPNE